jgi:hypothetical protein
LSPSLSLPGPTAGFAIAATSGIQDSLLSLLLPCCSIVYAPSTAYLLLNQSKARMTRMGLTPVCTSRGSCDRPADKTHCCAAPISILLVASSAVTRDLVPRITVTGTGTDRQAA